MNFIPIYIASVMIVAVIMILTYVAYTGYDVRSRGFDSRSNVLMTFYVNKITFKSYYERRNLHPIVNEEFAKKARMYKIGFYALAVILVVLVVVVVLRVVL